MIRGKISASQSEPVIQQAYKCNVQYVLGHFKVFIWPKRVLSIQETAINPIVNPVTSHLSRRHQPCSCCNFGYFVHCGQERHVAQMLR
jgi:hypothetical protein